MKILILKTFARISSCTKSMAWRNRFTLEKFLELQTSEILAEMSSCFFQGGMIKTKMAESAKLTSIRWSLLGHRSLRRWCFSVRIEVRDRTAFQIRHKRNCRFCLKPLRNAKANCRRQTTKSTWFWAKCIFLHSKLMKVASISKTRFLRTSHSTSKN